MGNNITIEFKKRDFGTGYSSFSFSETGNGALSKDSTSDDNIISTPQNTGVFQIQVATSVADLTRQITAHAEASGAILGADVGGTADFLRRTKFTANQTYIVARVAVQTEIQNIRPNNLAIDGDDAKLSPRQFVAKFGDLYLSEVHLGGSLTLIITVESEDIDAKTTFDASARANSGTFTSSGKFGLSFESITKNQELDIFVSHLGGDAPPDDVHKDVDTAIKYALGFEAAAGRKPVVYEAVFSPYANVPNAPAGLGRFTEGPAANLAGLVALKQQYLDARALIQYALQSADAFGLTDQQRDQLAGLDKQAGQDVDVIDENWKHSDITQIPSPAQLKFQHPPDAYAARVKQLNLDAASRVNFGAKFYLEWAADGTFVSSQAKGFPTVGKAPKVALRAVQGSGALRHGVRVNLETTEDALAKTPRLAASRNHVDLVYEDVGFEAAKQTWVLLKADPSDPNIRYDDKVFVESVFFEGQQVKKVDKKEGDAYFLTTDKPGNGQAYAWKVRRPPA